MSEQLRSEADARLDAWLGVFDAAGVATVVFTADRVVAASGLFGDWFGAGRGGDSFAAVLAALGPCEDAIGTTGDGLQLPRRKPLRYADGRVMELTLLPYATSDGAAAQIALFRDITDTARRELEYERQRAFLEKAQAVAQIGSWIAELDGSDLLSWSSEMYHIAGWPRERAITRARAMHELVHPDDREAVARARNAALTAGPTFGIEHRIVRPDHSVRWVHTRGELVRDPQEKPLRMIGTMQDVTERRALEDQLRQSQKLEALGRLASGIAHDINNALTAIIGYTEQAIEGLEHLPADDPLRQDVHEIQRAARRAEAVTRQLPAFSRRQVQAPRVFQLEDAVHEMSRMLTRAIGPAITLQTLVEPALPPIYGDRLQIEQALVNLAVNARDAMAATGGTLTIKLRATTVDTASARRFERMRVGRYVELTVTDTGHGMDSETLARVFEPFFTTKEPGKGTGLGLAMVYATVTQSGGFIYVESELQHGTTFRAFFPVSMARRRADAAVSVQVAPAAARAATVLIREDPSLRTIFMTGQEPSEALTATLGPLRRVLSKPFAPSDLRRVVREILTLH